MTLSCSHFSKARMNLHWCFLAVSLNNIFLWLKLLSVIVSRYFCDSQSSGVCMMNLSLASTTLPRWCAWGLCLCAPCLSGWDVHGLSGTVFMGYSLNKKRLNDLIKSLGSGLRLPVTTYLMDDRDKLLNPLYQIPTLRMGILTVTYLTGTLSSWMIRRVMPSTVVISAQWMFNIVLTMMFGNSFNYSSQPPYFWNYVKWTH